MLISLHQLTLMGNNCATDGTNFAIDSKISEKISRFARKYVLALTKDHNVNIFSN